MTTREKIGKALEIAERADPGGQVWAGHDVFSIASPAIDLTDEDRRQLRELGFRPSEELGWSYCT